MTLFDVSDQPQKLDREAVPAEHPASPVAETRPDEPSTEDPLEGNADRLQPPEATDPPSAPTEEADSTETPPQVTVPQPTPTVTTPGVVTSVVSYLEREGVLRTRIDPDTAQPVVQLYHDYLSRAVVEAERRADRWPTVLREAHQQFTEAGDSLRRRWQPLLSPVQQLRLLIERLRPSVSFTYGPDRKFATCSLLRLVPHLIVMLAFFLSWQEWERQEQEWERREQHQLDRATAQKFMTDIIESESAPTVHGYNALEGLAESPEAVRLAFIDLVLEHEEIARRLENRYDYVVHAVVGLDMTMRDRVRDRLLERGEDRSDLSSAICVAMARLRFALSIPDNTDLNRLIADCSVAAMKETTGVRELSSLGTALDSLGEHLDATPASAVAQQIIAAMKKTTDGAHLSYLNHALGHLSKRLKRRDVVSVLKSVVCVGRTREQIVKAITERPDWESGSDVNLWTIVKWAEAQGVDVEKTPRWPLPAENPEESDARPIDSDT